MTSRKIQMKKGLFPTWDEEREYRLSLLECRICGGNPSSVCECAKKLYFEKVSKATEVAKNKRSRTNTTTTLTEDEQLEQEWISHKGLVCSPVMTLCSVCPNGEWQSFCACAKAAWINGRNRAVGKTEFRLPLNKKNNVHRGLDSKNLFGNREKKIHSRQAILYL